MNRKLTTSRIVVSGAFALSVALGSAGTALAAGHDGGAQPATQGSTDKQGTPKQTTAHAEEADGSDHGATGKPAKDDPNPGKGKDCIQHGNHGGINEDHCGPVDRPEGPGSTPDKPETKPQPKPEPEPEKPETKPEPKPEDTTPGHDCNICKTVTPPTPVVLPVCGPDNDQVTLPAATGVIWQRGEWSNGTLVVKAISADWYTFPTGDVVEHVIKDANNPCTTPTTPPAEDCDNTCPTPTTPITPAPEKPATETPAKPTKPVVETPAQAKPAKPAGTPVSITPAGHTPVEVVTVTPAGVMAEAPAKATANGAPVFNSGVEGDGSGLGAGALGAGVLGAVAAGLMTVPAIRRRQNA